MQNSQHLIQQNLVPIYILEDKLKENFKKTNSFISSTRQNSKITRENIIKLQKDQAQMKRNFDDKMIEMEKKIVQQISQQLEGRITISISKSITSFTDKLDKKQKQMDNITSQFDRKLTDMKKNLAYSISQQNQKFFLRQARKLEDKFKDFVKKSPSTLTNHGLSSQKQVQSNQNWQSQHHSLKQLQTRIEKMEDFSVNVQKRFYNSMTSLKQSWKQLGIQLLQNKKGMQKKFEQLKTDFIKLKNLKDFEVIPEKIESDFKRKLADKFSDIYQMLAVSLTKKQFQTVVERQNQKITRHDDQLIEMRKEIAENNQFFTFYADNSDQDDLKRMIVALQEHISEQKTETNEKIKLSVEQNKNRVNQINKLKKQLNQAQSRLSQKGKQVNQVAKIVETFQTRIKNLQDFNRFGPDKLQKIHNSLQINFSADEQQLLKKKEKKNYQLIQKNFRVQISKLKDQLFIVNSQNQVWEQQVNKMKKMQQNIQEKISKLKFENQEAMVSRKPWVCLSCDKQQKQKEPHKNNSKKRLQPFKGFGTQKGSQKSLKITNPPYQQRFQVYERFKQKYLSDTVKLPQIYKEKIKDKQTSFQN